MSETISGLVSFSVKMFENSILGEIHFVTSSLYCRCTKTSHVLNISRESDLIVLIPGQLSLASLRGR